MSKCDINCEYCWCKVFYAKSGIVTAYCAKAKRLHRPPRKRKICRSNARKSEETLCRLGNFSYLCTDFHREVSLPPTPPASRSAYALRGAFFIAERCANIAEMPN